MNQHASRPVAQGFPLHLRTNGPTQPTGTQLRHLKASTANGGPLRRSLFKSQIPIRIGFGTQRSVAQSSQQALLQVQSLEQRRQLFTTSQNSATASLQAIRTSAGQQPIETAFKIYEDRLQSDFRDFRTMCCRLILQEQEEKEKWHTLCLKMMKERDMARQRVSERDTHLWSPPAISVEENVTSKVSKRARDETDSVAQENTQELLSCSSPVGSRPIRNLRSSPIPSPPGSPSASCTAINPSSHPPSSSPPLPNLTPTCPSTSIGTPLTLSLSPETSLDITNFNPTRSPNDKTCFDVYGAIDIPETRPVKRRKSYDSSSKPTVQTTETKDSSGSKSEVEASTPRRFLIAHTDIMYMPMKGRLFCRACLMDKMINPSSGRHPQTYPTDVCWDELRDHCVTEHPKACADVARLCPADLNEVRRRLYN